VKLVEKWLRKLSAHFHVELTVEQIEVFLDELVANSDYQIQTAFERCLNECMFMPKLREVHDKIPEDREPQKIWKPQVSTPTLELVRPYARVAAQQLYGMELEQIEVGPRLMKCFFFGSRARAHHMGIDTSKWPQWDDRLEALIGKIT